jgi:peptide/nickel transport system permease protein
VSRYILRQLILAIPTILLLTLFVFGLIYLIPGDPAEAMLGQTASPEAIAAFRQKMRLDEPFLVQYLSWLGRLAQGDLGRSVRTSQPVWEAVVSRLPVTLQLSLYAMLIALVLGVPIGMLAALKRGSLWDLGAQVLALTGLSTPGFFLAILCILLFSLKLHILPAAGYVSPLESVAGSLRSLTLPAFALGFAMIGALSRMTRASALDVLNENYVRTSRAKGLAERVVLYRHVLKNALIPVVTLAGLQLGFVLGGTIVIESIFGLPGMGRLMIDNIYGHDFPMVQGVVLFLAVVRLAVNLFTDVTYAFLDPQVRFD